MLGLGIWEMALVAALLLVVVGPDRLPQVLRWAGQNYAKLRRTADELRRAFVLEADRQDAEERLRKLRERQQKAREEADAALKNEPSIAPPSLDPGEPEAERPADAPAPAHEAAHFDAPVGQQRRFSAPPPAPAAEPPGEPEVES